MAKRAKKEENTSGKTLTAPVAKQPEVIPPRVTFSCGERVEVTVDGDECRRLVQKLIGCVACDGVLRISLTGLATGSPVAAVHCRTPGHARDLEESIDG